MWKIALLVAAIATSGCGFDPWPPSDPTRSDKNWYFDTHVMHCERDGSCGTGAGK